MQYQILSTQQQLNNSDTTSLLRQALLAALLGHLSDHHDKELFNEMEFYDDYDTYGHYTSHLETYRSYQGDKANRHKGSSNKVKRGYD
ncbi:hypothetical protein Pcinc_030392 [Petrolisthes cinctipes]|uniref:Uncharacterized protein n=1 Tax=Petrolisthes cinctipes TaxID=88211 RepID=A0AAE1K647_PETCI|nr:hypothetical protein Pcinc_030392 [Petrolisthes cinctipes]